VFLENRNKNYKHTNATDLKNILAISCLSVAINQPIFSSYDQWHCRRISGYRNYWW